MGCGSSSGIPQDVIEQENNAAAELEKLKKQRQDTEAKKAEEKEVISNEKLKEDEKRKAEQEAAFARVQAAEEAVRVKVEQEAAEEAVRVRAEEEAAEEAARVKVAEEEAAEEAARVRAEQEAAEEAARVKAEKEAAEEAARVMAEKEAAEEAARVKVAEEEREEREREKASLEERAITDIMSALVTEAEQTVCLDLARDLLEGLVAGAEDRAREEPVPGVAQEQHEHEQQAAALSASMDESVKVGWLSKQGHVVKNWKKRWFVLQEGVLRYYTHPLQEAPFGRGLKGEMTLENYVVRRRGDRSFELQACEDQTAAASEQRQRQPGLLRRLSTGRPNSAAKIKCESTLLEAEHPQEARDWEARLQEHIDRHFRTDYCEESAAAQREFMRGPLEVKGPLAWQRRWFSLRLNKLGKLTVDCCHCTI
jgi:hypothetical protein